MSRAGTVHFVVPEGVDDPSRASGGNVFDLRLAQCLAAIGWEVRMIPVDTDAAPGIEAALAGVPDGGLTLLDGLIASRAPGAVERSAARLRVVVIAHMVSAAFPHADPRMVGGERRALRVARLIVATSAWTRAELLWRELAPPGRIVVANPGSDDAPPAAGTPSGRALLCVGVVAPHKGQDTLVEALAALPADEEWTCTFAGSLAASPDFAARIAAQTADADLDGRITLAGVLDGAELARAYRRTDLLVAPSRAESYGMAIADALRRGIPVLASRVGGIPRTVAPGHGAVLVPPGEPRALTDALHQWMVDPSLRARLKDGARLGRGSVPRWSDTAERVAAGLAGVR